MPKGTARNGCATRDGGSRITLLIAAEGRAKADNLPLWDDTPFPKDSDRPCRAKSIGPREMVAARKTRETSRRIPCNEPAGQAGIDISLHERRCLRNRNQVHTYYLLR